MLLSLHSVTKKTNNKKHVDEYFLSPHGNCDGVVYWKHIIWCYKFDLQIADKTKNSTQMGKFFLINTVYWESVFHKSIVLSMPYTECKVQMDMKSTIHCTCIIVTYAIAKVPQYMCKAQGSMLRGWYRMR